MRYAATLTLFALSLSCLLYSQDLIREKFVNVHVYCSPTLDFTGSGHLRYGISFDKERPQLIDLAPDTTGHTWERSVADNIRIMAPRKTIPGRPPP